MYFVYDRITDIKFKYMRMHKEIFNNTKVRITFFTGGLKLCLFSLLATRLSS